MVAFANAEGGNLVLGIRETSERPARPDEINPLPNCHDLAERIRYVARDCIEPQIPSIEVVGVSSDDEGAGIVLIRVPPSRMAPHRVAPTGRCTMRRADRTETMTMREIQDRTIDLARGDERLREKLEERRENYFKNVFKHASQSSVIGVRATLIPVRTVVQIDRPYDQKELAFLWEPEFTGTIDGKQAQLIRPGRQTGANPLRPVLRGGLDKHLTDIGVAWRWISAEGMVEIGFRLMPPGLKPPLLHPGYLLATVANVLIIGDTFRALAGIPSAEFALDVEVRCDRESPTGRTSVPLHVASFWYGDLLGGDPLGMLDDELPLRFPLSSVGERESFNQIMTIVCNDLLNALGHRSIRRLEVNWPR